MYGALILAGGNSKRMGRNKALINFGNTPLLRRVVERIMPIVHDVKVVIAKNDNPSEYSAVLPPSIRILKDTVSDKGPLAGILVGLENVRSEYVAVLPCDSPFVKSEVLEYLFRRAEGADAAIPRWPNGTIEPLQAVYRASSSLLAAKAALQEDELLVIDMVKRLDKVVYLDVDELRRFDHELVTFFNINSEEDLTTARILELKLR